MSWSRLAAFLLAGGCPWSRDARCRAGLPKGPVKIVIPFPPGGPTDTVGRLIGQKLQETWGQPVLIDYKPGAGTAIGVDFVAKSAPDGHIFGMVNSSLASTPTCARACRTRSRIWRWSRSW
jgi:tripartite-type tricarboxylate transporter receptor subunit TctC